MLLVAKVVVEIALNREFDYAIPTRLQGQVVPGSMVTVPFGRRAATRGYVIDLADSSPYAGLKEIQEIVGDGPMVQSELLALAKWISRYYCAPVESAIRAVLPAVIRKRGQAFRSPLFLALVEPLPDIDPPTLKKKSPLQATLLDLLLRSPGGLFLQDALRQSGASPEAAKALVRKGWVTLTPRTQERDPLLPKDREILPTDPLPLMAAQATALKAIQMAMAEPRPPVILLHGVTGSGKTEVYMQAIDHVLAQGKTALVLVPEIALTPQMIERFLGRFHVPLAIQHSHLSDGERHDMWHRVREGRARIMIGARSAVFAPLKNLGLIVVDEEHEPSYKQDELPRYHARDVAVMRGHLEKCVVVLGSATPALESYRNARQGKYRLISLPHRVDHRQMPGVRVVDMRQEAAKTGKINAFSSDLVEAMRHRLSRAEQTILFLNRRGYATSLLCPKCGYIAQCPECNLAYTYHRQSEQLRCHICGAVKGVPGVCPTCQDPAFRYSGLGTQKVEEFLCKLFPKAKIQRMDADMTSGKDAHARILNDFRVGRIDILVGTQMVAKGLDFPNVTLIGVVNADLSLHMPDFRAGERTVQLLIQVAGRAGRGDLPGEVLIQTYTPFHPAIQMARRLDFDGFCDQELEFRKELNYPPFTHLVCLQVQGRDEIKVRTALDEFFKRLQPRLPSEVIITEPAPAALAKAKGSYRFQMLLRTTRIMGMTEILRRTLDEFKWPSGVDCTTDVDAMSV
jgi:primosomal protein N' (replication factor Y)